MNKLLLACLPLALLSLLSACTGTDEPPLPTRLVTLEGDATLRATDVGTSAPAATVTAPDKVIGIATVANGAKLAVAYAGQLEFRDANLNVLGDPVSYPSLFFTNNFAPVSGNCFARLASDVGGTRLAVYEACPGRPDVLALFDSVGALRYQVALARVPTDLSVPNTRLGITVLNDTVWLALPSTDPRLSDVVRVTPDAPGPDFIPGVSVPQATVLTPSAPRINDLAATAGGTVYAAVGNPLNTTAPAGLFTLPAGVGSLTATVLTDQASRVWAKQGVLAAWNETTGLLTVAGAANLNARFTQTVVGLLDLTVTQDGYLYALQPGGLTCYDVVQLQSVVSCPPEASTNLSLSGGRQIAWVLAGGN